MQDLIEELPEGPLLDYLLGHQIGYDAEVEAAGSSDPAIREEAAGFLNCFWQGAAAHADVQWDRVAPVLERCNYMHLIAPHLPKRFPSAAEPRSD